MSQRLLKSTQKVFPLDRLMKSLVPINLKDEVKQKPILLTKLSELDFDKIHLLETAGIFDTSDFLRAGEDLINILAIEESDFVAMKEAISNEYKQNRLKVGLSLDFPENYASVAIMQTETCSQMAYYWSGILFSWTSDISEGWSLIKFEFDRIHSKSGYPRLIGIWGDFMAGPKWLQEIDDISVYLSGIDVQSTINQIAKDLGFIHLKSFSHTNETEMKVLQIEYCFHTARENQVSRPIGHQVITR